MLTYLDVDDRRWSPLTPPVPRARASRPIPRSRSTGTAPPTCWRPRSPSCSRDAQCGIGPPTDDGFFYDFLVAQPFTPEDLVAIEKKMAHIVKQNRPIEKKLLPKAEALALFAGKGQTLKCQLIEEKAGEQVQCYTMGEFIDFCLGPHLPSTKEIKAFKLKPAAVAVLLEGQRGQPRDAAHLRVRVLHEGRAGRSTSIGWKRRSAATTASSAASSTSSRSQDETGAGLILWHPKGGFIRKQIEDYWRDRAPRGRLRPRLQPAHREARPLEDVAATPSTTRRTCTRRSRSRTSSTS